MNTKKYVLILLVLITAGLIYYFSQSKSTLDDEFDIAIESIEDINKFDLSSKSETLAFEKEDEKWLIGGQNVASQSRVDEFLGLLNTINVSSPVTGSKGQEVIDNIEELGIRVNCYKSAKQIYQIFFVANPKGLQGNYIYKPGNKYLMQLSQRSNLQQVFSIDPFVWQSKTIFSIAAQDIKTITLDWEEKKDFTVQAKSKGTYDFYIGNANQTELVNGGKLKYYTYEFANVSLDDKDRRCEEQVGERICAITITDNNNRKTTALFFELKKTKSIVDKNQLVVNLKGTDVWGKVSYVKMSPILKQADFFITQ